MFVCHFFGFLVVFEGPGLFRGVLVTGRIDFHLHSLVQIRPREAEKQTKTSQSFFKRLVRSDVSTWSTKLAMSDPRFGFYGSKSSPGTPPHVQTDGPDRQGPDGQGLDNLRQLHGQSVRQSERTASVNIQAANRTGQSSDNGLQVQTESAF